ncbi:MAG TPA: LCP family protein [Acidimicrobiia bacterium]|nr:LCP family protein [Acidimicrobiia bacterium]
MARPRRHRAIRALALRFLTAFLIAATAMAGGVIAVNTVINAKLATAKRVRVHTAIANGGPVNFLLLGADQAALDQLSDTMWVVRVDPDRKTALVVSFPRDLWVNVPGHGRAKINASNNGGPQLVIDTMRQDFGIPINHYVQVDYPAFKGVVDAIGTVPVYVPYPARDQVSGFYSPIAGCKQFSGYDALQYVRSRGLSYYSSTHDAWLSADAIPDIDRIARQQNFVRSLATLAAQKAKSNPLTANTIADRVLAHLTVDAGLSRDDVLTLVDTFVGINPNDARHIRFETIPSAEGPNQQGESVLYLSNPAADSMIQSLGGTGVGNNPTSATPGSATTSTSSGSGVGGGESVPSSSVLHASINDASALGPPAANAAPCTGG